MMLTSSVCLVSWIIRDVYRERNKTRCSRSGHPTRDDRRGPGGSACRAIGPNCCCNPWCVSKNHHLINGILLLPVDYQEYSHHTIVCVSVTLISAHWLNVVNLTRKGCLWARKWARSCRKRTSSCSGCRSHSCDCGAHSSRDSAAGFWGTGHWDGGGRIGRWNGTRATNHAGSRQDSSSHKGCECLFHFPLDVELVMFPCISNGWTKLKLACAYYRSFCIALFAVMKRWG